MDRLADRRAGRAMREVEGEAADGPVEGAGGLHKLVRAVFLVALAVAAFVLTGRLIDARAPLHVPLLSVKWAHFMAHRDEYTTVYIGTSVVRHHIVPEVVDAEMRARGVRERSFNLGMSHMTYSEARLLVERLAGAAAGAAAAGGARRAPLRSTRTGPTICRRGIFGGTRRARRCRCWSASIAGRGSERSATRG
jgi:hypothetical protein